MSLLGYWIGSHIIRKSSERFAVTTGLPDMPLHGKQRLRKFYYMYTGTYLATTRVFVAETGSISMHDYHNGCSSI